MANAQVLPEALTERPCVQTDGACSSALFRPVVSSSSAQRSTPTSPLGASTLPMNGRWGRGAALLSADRSDGRQASKDSQDSSGSGKIKVCVRVRPFSSADLQTRPGDEEHKADSEPQASVRVPTQTTIVLDCSHLQGGVGETFGHRKTSARPSIARGDSQSPESDMMMQKVSSLSVVEHGDTGGERSFTFDRVYQSFVPGSPDLATQSTLMEELGEEMKGCVLSGYNTCLLAYGQTSSGKTFSILGNDMAPENRGLLPRVVEQLFWSIEEERAQGRGEFLANVTYVEIYNERIRDLLKLPGQPDKRLEVAHSPSVGAYVRDLKPITVQSERDVMRYLELGMKARTVAATCMNDQSSRSHCIFTIEVHSTRAARGRKLRAKLNLVDLAGSERQSKSQASGMRLKEGSMINKSLTTLAMCVRKLAEASDRRMSIATTRRNQDFIPFRDSKLTDMLQDSLGGNSQTLLIAAVSPAESNAEETLSTLRFAEGVKQIRTKAVVNEEGCDDVVTALKLEIEQLKATLAASDGDQEQSSSYRQNLAGLETLMGHYGEDVESRLRSAAEHEKACQQALEDMGLSLIAMTSISGLDASTPQLVNVSHDPSLQGCLVFFVPRRDEPAGVGSAAGNGVKISGLGIKPEMAKLLNRNDINVFIQPCEGRVLVNGNRLEAERELRNGDRLIFGHSFCFRVSIPLATEDIEAAKAQWNFLEHALMEVMPEENVEFEGTHLFMEDLHRRVGGACAQAFFQGYRRSHDMVTEANLITQELRPKDNLEFCVEVVMDLTRYQNDAPKCVVRLKRREAGKERFRNVVRRKLLDKDAPRLGQVVRELSAKRPDDATRHIIEDIVTAECADGFVSIAVYDMAAFAERLEQLRGLYEVFHRDGVDAISFEKPDEDPWLYVQPWEITPLLEEAFENGKDTEATFNLVVLENIEQQQLEREELQRAADEQKEQVWREHLEHVEQREEQLLKEQQLCKEQRELLARGQHELQDVKEQRELLAREQQELKEARAQLERDQQQLQKERKEMQELKAQPAVPFASPPVVYAAPPTQPPESVDLQLVAPLKNISNGSFCMVPRSTSGSPPRVLSAHAQYTRATEQTLSAALVPSSIAETQGSPDSALHYAVVDRPVRRQLERSATEPHGMTILPGYPPTAEERAQERSQIRGPGPGPSRAPCGGRSVRASPEVRKQVTGSPAEQTRVEVLEQTVQVLQDIVHEQLRVLAETRRDDTESTSPEGAQVRPTGPVPYAGPHVVCPFTTVPQAVSQMLQPGTVLFSGGSVRSAPIPVPVRSVVAGPSPRTMVRSPPGSMVAFGSVRAPAASGSPGPPPAPAIGGPQSGQRSPKLTSRAVLPGPALAPVMGGYGGARSPAPPGCRSPRGVSPPRM